MNIPFDFGSMIGPSCLSDPFSGSVQVEHPQENLPALFSRVSNSLILFSPTHGSCENRMHLSLKWPIYGCRLKERLPGSASVTFLLLLPPPLLFLSILQRCNIFLAPSIYLWPKYAAPVCHAVQQAFQWHHKDGLSHALNCLFERNE